MRGPISAVILAAGASRRFSGDKRRALWQGKPLLHHVIATFASQVDDVVVVLRPDDDPALVLPVGYYGRIARPAKAGGMGDSLAVGAATCGHSRALLVTLADLPAIRQDTVSAVVDALDSFSLVQPHCQGHRGHPVGFDRCHFAALRAQSGDQGARHLLKVEQPHLLPVEDTGIHSDIDTQEQLDAFASR